MLKLIVVILFFSFPILGVDIETSKVSLLETGWTFTDFNTGKTVPIIVGLGLIHQGFQAPIHGTYRIELNFKNDLFLTQSVYLDRIHSVDRTFWNGREIGHTGSFSPNYYPYWLKTRFYSISTDMLKKGTNALEIEVECRETVFKCGLFRSVPKLGSSEEIKDDLIYQDISQIALAILFFGIFLQQAIGYFLNRSSYSGLFLSATAIFYIGWQLPLLNKIHYLGLPPEFLVRSFFFCQSIFPVLIILFVYTLFGSKIPKFIILIFILDSLISLFMLVGMSPDLRVKLVYIWYGLLFLKVPLLIFLLVKYSTKKTEAIIVSVGALFATVFGLADVISDIFFGKNAYLTQYGIFGFMFSGVFAISLQNARARKDLRNLNESLEIIVNLRTTELMKQNKLLNHEILMAASLQSKLIPPMQFKLEGLGASSVFIPMEKIGGDYFDYRIHDNHTVMFLLCDVLGHGIAAALIASMLKISFLELGPKFTEPDQLLAELNWRMIPVVEKNFITALAVCFDLKNREVSYSVMGHPSPFFISGSGEDPVVLPGRGPILGWRKDAKIELYTQKLRKDDRFFFYTDGVTEARNSERELFGEERVYELLKDSKELTLESMNAKVLNSVKQFSPRLSDDVTFFTVEIY